MDHTKDYQEGLREALAVGRLTLSQYNQEVEALDHDYEPVMQEIKTLKDQKKILLEDVEEAYEVQRKRYKESNEQNEPDVSFLERAYTSVMVAKVMSASAKQKKTKFDQSKFKRDVLSYYNAFCNLNGMPSAYCHVTGWHDITNVKAAHLVPKSLHSDELEFLFGVRELVLLDPRNGLPHSAQD